MQRRDTLGERTSDKGLSTEQNTDTHRTRKLMAGMVLKMQIRSYMLHNHYQFAHMLFIILRMKTYTQYIIKSWGGGVMQTTAKAKTA